MANALAPLGVAASHTRPHSPNSNGKVERFHRTAQKWLTKQPATTTITGLQAQLDEFRNIYNTTRPHRSLSRQFPADVWHHAPKTGPSTQPLGTPTSAHNTIVRNGRCHAGAYAISIGSAHNGQHALTIITGTACHVFINGHLIRQLTIKPDQHAQPLYTRRGRPPKVTEREAPRHT